MIASVIVLMNGPALAHGYHDRYQPRPYHPTHHQAHGANRYHPTCWWTGRYDARAGRYKIPDMQVMK